MAIIRGEALYKQVAAKIREAINTGTYRPGQPLPSETDLMGTYGVSRPTVRQAVSVLRSEGLVDVIHGKGTFVRSLQVTGGATAPLTRTITRAGQRYQTPTDHWALIEKPTPYRIHTDRTTGPFLGMAEEEPMMGCDRLLVHKPTGSRALHRLLLPTATIKDTPLAHAPETPPEQAYTILAAAGHQLTWRETVRTRLPPPNKRATLHLPEATPTLITYRITHDANDHDRALILEETHIGGDTGELTYTLQVGPQQPRAKNSP